MNGYSLINSPLLLFVLYATVGSAYRWMYREVQPGLRGFDWFVGAQVLFAAAASLSIFSTHGHAQLGTGMATVLLLGGQLLLHLAFAKLVDDHEAFLHAQLVLVVLGLVTLCWPLIDTHLPASTALVQLVSGLQYALVGWIVLRAEHGPRPLAGVIAGGSLAIYAICHVAWSLRTIYRSDFSGIASGRVPATVQLVAHAAIMFSFLMLAGSRLVTNLEREAQIDELTGLINLRAMRKSAAKAIAECQRKKGQVGVLMIDLDNLKQVNDRLGHGAGDALLPAVAYALSDLLREGDDLARVGGDEFCMLMPSATEEEALRMAQRCRLKLADLQVSYRGERILVSASFGVSHTSVCGWHWEELLRRSDAALYQAKHGGKNKVIFAERAKKTSVLWQLSKPGARRRFELVRSRFSIDGEA